MLQTKGKFKTKTNIEKKKKNYQRQKINYSQFFELTFYFYIRHDQEQKKMKEDKSLQGNMNYFEADIKSLMNS